MYSSDQRTSAGSWAYNESPLSLNQLLWEIITALYVQCHVSDHRFQTHKLGIKLYVCRQLIKLFGISDILLKNLLHCPRGARLFHLIMSCRSQWRFHWALKENKPTIREQLMSECCDVRRISCDHRYTIIRSQKKIICAYRGHRIVSYERLR